MKAEPPANDALLAQLVRGALGRSGISGINVCSCSFVVTLHGCIGSVEEKARTLIRAVPGVGGVVNKLRDT